MFDQTVNFVTHTNGRGYWSTVSGCVKINRVRLAYLDDDGEFGELRAYFDRAEWDTDKDGLIYTDPAWIESFINCMATLGFSESALQDIDYSEQGMQGDNYVSMDVGADFVRECEALHRFVINRQAVNS
jgi:hypothetical protein